MANGSVGLGYDLPAGSPYFGLGASDQTTVKLKLSKFMKTLLPSPNDRIAWAERDDIPMDATGRTLDDAAAMTMIKTRLLPNLAMPTGNPGPADFSIEPGSVSYVMIGDMVRCVHAYRLTLAGATVSTDIAVAGTTVTATINVALQHEP